MLRGVHIAQVTDVHPTTFEVSVIFPDLSHAEGARVRVTSRRSHPTAGDYQLPERGDWGLVAFWTEHISSGLWLFSTHDLHRHLIPTELLEADPHARLDHRPSDRYTIEHGDGTEEHVWPDGTLLKLTTRKDDTLGNATERAAITPRYRTLSPAYGKPGERKPYAGREQPPVDVLLNHSSGAQVLITADGSFRLTTPAGHTLKLHDATEKVRSSDDGSVTSAPEEGANRVASEVILSTEVGHQVILHDDPILLADRRITILHAGGHKVEMKDDPTPQADQYVRVQTAGGHRIDMRDLPTSDQHLRAQTNAGHVLELRDTPTVKATITTPLGRSIVMDDDVGTTTITDPAKVVVDAPIVELGGGGAAIARVGDKVATPAGIGTIQSGSSKVFGG